MHHAQSFKQISELLCPLLLIKWEIRAGILGVERETYRRYSGVRQVGWYCSIICTLHSKICFHHMSANNRILLFAKAARWPVCSRGSSGSGYWWRYLGWLTCQQTAGCSSPGCWTGLLKAAERKTKKQNLLPTICFFAKFIKNWLTTILSST